MKGVPTITLRRLLPPLLLAASAAWPAGAAAQQSDPTTRKVENPMGAAEQEVKALRRVAPGQITIVAPQAPGAGATNDADITAEKLEYQGDLLIYTGDVNLTYGDLWVFADRVTYNRVTSDVLAEGSVFFEQGGQKLSGERLELNLRTRRGSLFGPTGFTDRTPDGTTLVVEAARADKTSADTYVLGEAKLTACQERVPKWSFTAKRAKIRLEHRAQVYNALLRIKNVPVFFLPYASISIDKQDRASGFLLPSYGNSNIKGRTLHQAYFQTLGRSADLLVRGDLFSKRGLGLGFDFRARPDERSRIAVGSFIVFDRLLGPKTDASGQPLPDQGGSSFYADAVQYFKNGFIAVADVNVTSNFDFRQVFAENAQQAISPEERSQVYLNRNWRSLSFNALYNDFSAFLGTTIVKTRQLPGVELAQRATQISESFPVYFSFVASVDGVRRVETDTSTNTTPLKSPSIVQRLDLAPRLTFPLRPVAGFTLTPSLGLRSTFYSDSLDPVKREVIGRNLTRNYAEFALDLRPPALSRVFRHRDGTPWFKHLIEPFVAYRRIAGIDEYARTLRVDERDAVAGTSELEYGFTNRFFVRRPGPDQTSRQAHELLELTIAQKYFFDPTFGGALREGVRDTFYPINTLSGFAFGGVRRRFSPLNLRARVRPGAVYYGDLRLDYDTELKGLRDVVISGGLTRGILALSQSWTYTRRLEFEPARFDPSTFPGNQLDTAAFVGNPRRGPYGGLILSYDFRQTTNRGQDIRNLINLTTTGGWAWDCCSVMVQNVTFNVGVRNENRILVAFSLKGIGTFGTETFGQLRRQ